MADPAAPHAKPHDGASDIVRGTWLERVAPAAAWPYLRLARLDRPIGTWLVLLPGWWSIALAAPGPDGLGPDGLGPDGLGPDGPGTGPDIALIALFAVGAVVMRGAGCVVNDIADRDYDARVARTADRPLASGAVSVPRALAFLAVLLIAGLAILLQFNAVAIAVGAASLVLVFPYPLMKRITFWPQAWLGLTFNWGALLGWAAVRGTVEAPALVLYAAGFFWTLGYDTIYAHQDKDDDARIGVKSTALLFGAASRAWIAGFYAAAAALLAAAGWLAALAWPFYLGLAVAAAHLAWQARGVRFDDPKDCLAKFRANRNFGLIVFAAIIAGQLA